MATFQSINPYNQKTLGEFASLSERELEEKLRLGAETYRNLWRSAPLAKRLSAVQELADLMDERIDDLARLISLEMGKPVGQSRGEIKKCAWLCRYYAEHAGAFLEDQTIETEAHHSFVAYQPLGAVLGVMPWNFPFWQSFRFAIPALLAGNVVFLKPAPNVPQCGKALEQLFEEAIGEKGVFQTLFVEVEQVEHIIQHPLVQGVSLTGSDRAGSSVASLAGKHIKACVLELGGSDAFIVLEDADIAKAAETAALSRMNNTGQTCIAAKRWIVLEPVAEEFTDKVIQAVKAMKVGKPMDDDTEIGCMARPDLVDKLQQQIKSTLDRGARILLPGGRVNPTGNFFYPMILTDIPGGSPAYQEELFGPVGVLFVVKTEEEAIQLANDTDYGLGAAIWSNDLERADRVARKLEAGAIAINDMVSSDPRIPFGGIKRSGFGRELAKEGIREFVNMKSIVVNRG
jgi:succinate-semialdehyde dehydrogenase/glutarate-semialdehyde dehydrogenase